MSKILLTFLILSIACIKLVHSIKCSANEDCRTNKEYGEFSKCIDGVCHCLDFFVLSDSDTNNCTNVVPYGESCRESNQCRGTMGIHGICKVINATTRICDCENLTDQKMVLFNGRCTQVKKNGETCIEDGQCITGSNQFSRCNEGICGCLFNDIVEFTPNETGQCVLPRVDPPTSTLPDITCGTEAGTMKSGQFIYVFVYILACSYYSN